jgi:hypothetical protein
MDLLALLAKIPPEYLPYVAVPTAACAALSATLPAPTETSTVIYRRFHKFVNWVGLNVRHARNAEAAKRAETEQPAKPKA